MSTPDPTIEPAPEPQITKEELELKKLTLEIKDLERPFWKRPTYILAGLPTLLAVVTLSVGLFNGYFSASLTKLENQKHDLQSEVNEFEADKTQLHSDNERLRAEKKSLIAEKDLLEAEKDLLEARISEIQQGYEAQLANLKAKRTELEKNNGSLSQKNNDLLQAIKEQETKATKRLDDMRKQKEDLQAKLPKEPPVTCLNY